MRVAVVVGVRGCVVVELSVLFGVDRSLGSSAGAAHSSVSLWAVESNKSLTMSWGAGVL